MIIKQIFEAKLAQFAYIVGSENTGEAILIDPQRDVDSYLRFADQLNLKIIAVAETHIHADFVSGVRELASRQGIKLYAFDSPDPEWRYHWIDEGVYDCRMLNDGDSIEIGEIQIDVLHTPGHSPEHVSFLIRDRDDDIVQAILSGDFVFVGDVARPDLMDTTGGSDEDTRAAARTIYRSLDLFRKLPESSKVYPGHGAGSACGRAMSPFPSSTVGQELKANQAILAAENEERFVDHILEGQPEPPAYFGRMRSWNRQGPPILNDIPTPPEIGIDDIDDLLGQKNTVFLDTRSWYDFKAGHLPGAVFAPLDGQFNTLAGSYIDSDKSIILIVRSDRLEEAVRDLIRVGLDHIEGFLSPADMLHYAQRHGNIKAVSDISVNELVNLIEVGGVHPLDVRRISELEEMGHIPGASHKAHLQLALDLEDLPRDKPLAVYCKTGVRSTYATAFLQSQGFRVRNVSGGIMAWLAARLALEPHASRSS